MQAFLRYLRRAVLVFVILLLVVQLWFFSCVVWWKFVNPSTTRFMEIRLSQMREKNPKAQLQHAWVPYEKISSHMKRAAVAAEDTRFTQHFGVDWEAIEKARERNDKRGRVTHGGSTITQQLAKNLFLNSQRSYVRKGQELIITWMIEAVMPKRRILEIYLNVVEIGNGVYGVESGSRYYFGVSASQLDVGQAARLAAMLPAPRYFDRNRGSESLDRRAEVVLVRMNQVAIPK
jgi:monofunctional biosynthetic peptidoglycan transglycosylase